MTTEFKSREVSNVVINRLQPEGVGVSVLRSIGSNPRHFGPFLLLDNFLLEEGALQRGIGFAPHPHRGISTLTYILPNNGTDIKDNGSVQHKDHLGSVGTIGPGAIQYMVAGKGIVHSEMSADQRAISGLQLWINLHKKDKYVDPYYQEYPSEELPVVDTEDVFAKVIMGSALGTFAKVKTRTPVHYIHYRIKTPNASINHPLPPHWSTFLFSISGTGFAGSDQRAVGPKQTCFFKSGPGADEALAASTNDPNPEIDQNAGVTITAGADGFEFILISGEPINDGQPIVQHGPIAVNSQAEIMQFMDDYRRSKNGFEGAQKFIQNWQP